MFLISFSRTQILETVCFWVSCIRRASETCPWFTNLAGACVSTRCSEYSDRTSPPNQWVSMKCWSFVMFCSNVPFVLFQISQNCHSNISLTTWWSKSCRHVTPNWPLCWSYPLFVGEIIQKLSQCFLVGGCSFSSLRTFWPLCFRAYHSGASLCVLVDSTANYSGL